MNREIIPLMKEWYFHRGDIAAGQDSKLDDDEWKEIPVSWKSEESIKFLFLLKRGFKYIRLIIQLKIHHRSLH
jgi:hypothetical protein